MVRPASIDDLGRLADVEAAADALLGRAVGTPDAFTVQRPGEERAREPGFLLVVGDPVVGFAQVLEERGDDRPHAHLEQLCVDPAHGRRGLGRSLLEECCVVAAERGHAELTLTTYADVSFNAPYYARHGFDVVSEPGGVLLRHLEGETGLEAHGRRVGMRRRLR